MLVRSLEYGPSVGRPDAGLGLPDVQITYRFPSDYRVDLEGWGDDSKLLVDLLSIAKRVPLLSRTRYVRLARWIEEIDPNFTFGTRESGGYISDMWPHGCDLSKSDVDAFLELARNWHTDPDKTGALNLAIRRLAGSFSRPGGRFGTEDRILDVAIALEVLYGSKTGQALAARRRTAWRNCHRAKADIRPSEGGHSVGIVHWKRFRHQQKLSTGHLRWDTI